MRASKSEISLSWSVDNQFLVSSSALDIAVKKLPSGLTLTSVELALSNGKCVRGLAADPSPERSRLKAESELIERICYISQIDRKKRADADECEDFLTWLHQADLFELLSVASVMSTSGGFAAHADEVEAAKRALHEWTEKCLLCRVKLKGYLDQPAPSPDSSCSGDHILLGNGSCEGRALVVPSSYGFLAVHETSDLRALSSALHVDQELSIAHSLVELQVLESGLHFEHGTDEGLCHAFPLQCFPFLRFSAPSVPLKSVRVESSSGLSRIVSFPAFSESAIDLLRDRIWSQIEGNFAAVYPVQLRDWKTNEPPSGNLVCSVTQDLIDRQDWSAARGRRVLCLGTQILSFLPTPFCQNNLVMVRPLKDEHQAACQSQNANQFDPLTCDIRLVDKSLLEQVRRYLFESEIETRARGAWHFLPSTQLDQCGLIHAVLDFYWSDDFLQLSEIFVAIDPSTGGIMGAALMRLNRSQPTLHFVAVRPEFRSRKVGSRLIEAAIDSVKSKKDLLFAYVSVFNEPSRRMLNQNGFQLLGSDTYVL